MAVPKDHRISVAMLASTVVHALVLAGIVSTATRHVTPAKVPLVIPIDLVGLAGGGRGGDAGGTSTPVARQPIVDPPAPPPPTIETPKPADVPRAIAQPKRPVLAAKPLPAAPPREDTPSTSAVASIPVPGSGPTTPGAGTGGDSGAGSGSGGGTGSGDGTGGARLAFGVNPAPIYPAAAKRLGLEGAVTLSVLVQTDGSPGAIDVAKSSGHTLLDDAAVETVRKRWRFVPAKRDGVPFADRARFTIRFELRGG